MSNTVTFDPYTTYTIRDYEASWFTYPGVNFFNKSKSQWCTLPTMNSLYNAGAERTNFNAPFDSEDILIGV